MRRAQAMRLARAVLTVEDNLTAAEPGVDGADVLLLEGQWAMLVELARDEAGAVPDFQRIFPDVVDRLVRKLDELGLGMGMHVEDRLELALAEVAELRVDTEDVRRRLDDLRILPNAPLARRLVEAVCELRDLRRHSAVPPPKKERRPKESPQTQQVLEPAAEVKP